MARQILFLLHTLLLILLLEFPNSWVCNMTQILENYFCLTKIEIAGLKHEPYVRMTALKQFNNVGTAAKNYS